MISLLYGGITHHYLASSLPYCNKINNHGSIHNEYVIALVGNKDRKFGLIGGKDSACGSIFGPISSFTVTEQIEFIAGGYNTNFNKFKKLNIEPPSIGGITPVVGLDFKLPIYKTETFKIGIDTLVSFGIVTHSLRIDF
jgi:hypothetical protein